MQHDPMISAYVECALWAGTDGENPLDDTYSVSDLSAEALAEITQDCEAFAADNADDLADWTPEQAGHDFYLTRNGHGTGFWDRGHEAGDRLSAAAKVYGTSDLYPGDDGALYLSH